MLAVLVAALFGCDAQNLYPEGPIEVTGRVILLPGGDPLPDFGVELMRYVSPLGAAPVASIRTDSDGRFLLRHVVQGRERASYFVEVNSPYDSQYTVRREYLPAPPLEFDLDTIAVRLSDAP
jgi:hypothetical protein